MATDDTRPRRFDRFLKALRITWLAPWFVIRGFSAARGIDRASALAYITLLSLVPLLATIAALNRSFFSLHTDRIVEILTMVLPYTTEDLASTLAEFVNRATTLGGIGMLVFLAIVFRLFLTIETSLNQVWGVTTNRPAGNRVFSFTMVVFWGPVVMGLGMTFLFWWAPDSNLLMIIGRVVLPLLGLTPVYWLAPYTKVSLRSALAGAVTFTIGLQLLRTGFVAYLRYFPTINIIYGSLALAVIFLVSLFAFWTLVILGAQVSFVFQNLPDLLREHGEGKARRQDSNLAALAMLAECYRHTREENTLPTRDDLESGFDFMRSQTREITDRLVGAGLLALTGPNRDLLVPGRDASRLTVAAAVDAIRGHPDPELPGRGEANRQLACRLTAAANLTRESLASATFDDLFPPPDPAEDPPAPESDEVPPEEAPNPAEPGAM